MTQYKIQIGSWTKLPNGKVQKDTRDIMEMVAGKVGGRVEVFVAKVGLRWCELGVNDELIVKLYDEYADYADEGLCSELPLFIPYEELQKMLNAPQAQHTPSLLNTKLDCRKADGSVDEELSRAFQEACFEQGILWCGQYNDIRHLSSPFLFAEPDGCLGYTTLLSEEFFYEFEDCKQINFTYTRKLEWEATVVEPVEPVEEMVDICGVEYSAKELSEALALIKAARKG